VKLQIIDSAYKPLLENIQTHFHGSSTILHKARNEIKIVEFLGEMVVVKSFKIPNFLNKLIYTFFRDTKAKKSYDNSLKIGEFAPQARGYVEFKKFGLLYDSYFISKQFDYDFTIREVLTNSNFKDRDVIFCEFAAFAFKLHEKNIFHKDFSPGNILIKNTGDGYNFKIVDINRMVFKEFTLQDRLKNFSQLWAKDSDLKMIISCYAKLINIHNESMLDDAVAYSQKHKDIKNFKKRLKGKEVVD
jgi:serine/threonine protein kinase